MAISAREITQRARERAYYIEDVLTKSFCQAINVAVEDQVAHGRHQFHFAVPPIVMGYPCYNASYVAGKLRTAYQQSGFDVQGKGLDVVLTWKSE